MGLPRASTVGAFFVFPGQLDLWRAQTDKGGSPASGRRPAVAVRGDLALTQHQRLARFQQRLEAAEDEWHAAADLHEGGGLRLEAVVDDGELGDAGARLLEYPRDPGGRIRADVVVPLRVEAADEL